MKHKAFTLIETIVVLAIITIFFAVSVPLFSKLAAGTKLNTAARNIVSVLRTARGYAISNNKDYYVKCDNSAGVVPNEYYIYYKEPGSDITVDKIYKLPTEIWFYNPSGSEAIEFTNKEATFRPTGELNETDSKSVYIADGQTASARSKRINVEKTTGRVKIE